MKILIIAGNVGNTAPGIVFERLIQGLSKFHSVDILSAAFDPSIEIAVNRVIKIQRKNLHPRIERIFIAGLSKNPSDLLWSRKALNYFKKNNYTGYELVFSFICFSHYYPLVAGNLIAKKYKLRHMAYFVDAIPAPIGWLENNSFYRGTKKLISKYLQDIDGLFSANEKMLKYQLTIFKPKKQLITGVIYNPSFGGLQHFDNANSENYTFLYTGGLYGPRKPKYLLHAFKAILKEYPSATLEFVGSTVPADCFSEFNGEERKQISIHPFTRDLAPFYRRATALIDIDADLPDDIFLSSKITNYVIINRIIISQTGNNSPSREIFRNIPSILQCGHNSKEITDAMRQAIQKSGTADFSDRAAVVSLFDLNTVVEKINTAILI